MKLNDQEHSFMQRIHAGLKDIYGPEFAVAERLVWLGLIEGESTLTLNRGQRCSGMTLTSLGRTYLKV